MASSGNVRQPLRIDTPGYPDVAKRDLPTGGSRQTLTDICHRYIDECIPDSLMVQNNLSENDQLEPLLHTPENTCYRNAALAALFNLSPFVNFLHRMDLHSSPRLIMFTHLRELHDFFRNRSKGNTNSYKNRVDEFWKYINQGVQSWQGFCAKEGETSNTEVLKVAREKVTKENSMHDSTEFISWLFKRLEEVELLEPVMDDVSKMNLQLVFQRLFVFQSAARVAFTCCSKTIGTKQRVCDKDSLAGIMIDINFLGDQTSLGNALSLKFYDDILKKRECQYCKQARRYPTFTKLLYLPEVIFISANYTSLTGIDTNVRCNIPEFLDMSNLQDDPRSDDLKPGMDKANCIYRLEATICYPVENFDTGGHYIAYVRRGADKWDFVNDIPKTVRRVTMQKMQDDKIFRPRCLFYVRNRDIAIKDLPLNNVETVRAPTGKPLVHITEAENRPTQHTPTKDITPPQDTTSTQDSLSTQDTPATHYTPDEKYNRTNQYNLTTQYSPTQALYNPNYSSGNTQKQRSIEEMVQQTLRQQNLEDDETVEERIEEDKTEEDEARGEEAEVDEQRQEQGQQKRVDSIIETTENSDGSHVYTQPFGLVPPVNGGMTEQKEKRETIEAIHREVDNRGRKAHQTILENRDTKQKFDHAVRRIHKIRQSIDEQREWDWAQQEISRKLGAWNKAKNLSPPQRIEDAMTLVPSTCGNGPVITGMPAPMAPEREPEPAKAPWSIDTDPNDPRVVESKRWDVARFKTEFGNEGISQPKGNTPSLAYWHIIWRHHFNQEEKFYNIYSLHRLKKAAAEHDICVKHKGRRKPVKKDYVNALKRADQARLWEYKQLGGPAPDSEESSSSLDNETQPLLPPADGRKRRRDTEEEDHDETDQEGNVYDAPRPSPASEVVQQRPPMPVQKSAKYKTKRNTRKSVEYTHVAIRSKNGNPRARNNFTDDTVDELVAEGPTSKKRKHVHQV